MNKILVCTDFSQWSIYAIEMAILIGNKRGSEITLYHVIDQTRKDHYNKSERKVISDRLKDMADQFSPTDSKITTSVGNGDFINCLKEKLSSESYDLVVLGAHGSRGFDKFYLGSNTQKVIRKLSINTLTVSRPIRRNPLEKVLFASNLNKEDFRAFEVFLEFVSPFQPHEIHLLAVDTTNYFSQPTIVMKEALDHFSKQVLPQKIHTHFFADYSVEAGVRHFTENLGIDLIGISNVKRNAFTRILLGSTVEWIVSSSKIPVLSICPASNAQ